MAAQSGPEHDLTPSMVQAGIEEYEKWVEAESYLIADLVKNLYRRLRVLDDQRSRPSDEERTNPTPARRVAEIAAYPNANTSLDRLSEIEGAWKISFEDTRDNPEYVANPAFRNHEHRRVYDLCAMVRGLLSERETLETRIKELEGADLRHQAAINHISLVLAQTQSALLNARREAAEAMRERCRKVAIEHKGVASRERYKRGNRVMRFASEEAKQSVIDEERGEAIASELIAQSIASLPVDGGTG